MADTVARTVAIAALAVSAVAFYLTREAQQMHAEVASFTPHRVAACDPIINSCFDDGWRGARDDHGFPIPNTAAKAKVKRECPSANPLYVEAYGKCPNSH